MRGRKFQVLKTSLQLLQEKVVGKSTVAANMAISLQKMGFKVGLLDADIYGPSMPTMFDVEGAQPYSVKVNGKSMMEPIESMG